MGHEEPSSHDAQPEGDLTGENAPGLNPQLPEQGFIFASTARRGRRISMAEKLKTLPPLVGVKFLESTDAVELAEGRTLQAGTLTLKYAHPVTTPITDILRATFHLPQRRIGGALAAIALLSDHNALSSEDQQFHPTVIHYKGRERDTYFYLLPVDEREKADAFFRDHALELRSEMAFGISRKEAVRLQAGDAETVHMIKTILYRHMLSLLKMTSMSHEDIQNTIDKIMSNQKMMKLLIDEGLKEGEFTNFLRVFKTAVYRRTINYARDGRTRAKRVEDQKDQLRHIQHEGLKRFFTNHPLDSEEANRALLTLTPLQHRVFIARYLKNKSWKSIANQEAVATVSKTGFIAAEKLVSFIDTPIDTWPKPNAAQLIDLLKTDHPTYFKQFTQTLPIRWQEFLTYKFDRNFTDKQIAEAMGLTLTAAKAIGHRVYTHIVEKADGSTTRGV